MSDTTISEPTPRPFSRTDLKRTVVAVPILVTIMLCYWFLLPAIQSLFVPHPPGGANGPWVVRPISAFRYYAAGLMTAVTAAVGFVPLKRRWNGEDAALGTYDSRCGTPRGIGSGMTLGAWLLMPVYIAAPIFYLFSWTTVGPDGIEERLPWGRYSHEYRNVTALETIPAGLRSDARKQGGPWYQVRFRSGRRVTISLDNEGTEPEELKAAAAFIAARSRLPWVRSGDAR